MNKENKPFIVSLFSVIFLGLGLWNGFRFVHAIIFWSIISNYQSMFLPLYICISGLFWCIVWIVTARGFWLGKFWTWYGALISATGYGLWYWLDRIFLQRPHSNWVFVLGITLVFFLTYGLLLHYKVINFFFRNQSLPLCASLPRNK